MTGIALLGAGLFAKEGEYLSRYPFRLNYIHSFLLFANGF